MIEDARAKLDAGNEAPRAHRFDIIPIPEPLRDNLAAGENAELYIMAGVDHFMFGENDPRVINLVKDWVANYFPST